MGRTFVTFNDAAKLLKCSKRTVHNYVKRGLIRKEYENSSVVLCREDVEQLVEGSGSNLPSLTNRTLLELLGRIKSLEVKVAVFQKMNGIEDRPPLRPTPEEAEKLVLMVQFYLQKVDFSSPEIDLWVSTFSRMDELTFDILRRSGVKEDFWQDFFHLCLHLMDFVSDAKKVKNSRMAYQHHMELNECRKSLRSIILMWVELGHGKVQKGFRKHLSGDKDDLIQRLSAIPSQQRA